MITQNPAFQVLVTSGNQGVAAAGIRPEALLSGQLGVFDYNTGLSVDGSNAALNKNVFIAVGVARGSAAGSASTDIQKSAGENIEKAAVISMTQKPAVAATDKKVVLTVGTLQADTDYGVRIQFRSQEAYRNFGYNTPSKSAVVTSPADVSTVGAKNAVVIALGKEILKADEDEGILSVAYLDPSSSAVVNATDATALATWQATSGNETEVLKIQITASATAIKAYSDVNLNYINNRLTNIIVSLISGFDTTASVAVTQELVFQEMSGYDLNQLEYEAGGFNGKPGIYRESSVGFAASDRLAVAGTNYGIITINYNNSGIGGGLPYRTSLSSIVAIPSADSTTFTAVENLLNLVFRDVTGANTANEMSVENS